MDLRDGTEATITRVDAQRCQSYPVETTRGSVTEEGTYRLDRVPYDVDLIRPKVPPIDLTKPLRFKGETDGGFMLHELENVPGPIMVKLWATVFTSDGYCDGVYDTREKADRNRSNEQVVVELTGEYTP